MSGTDEILGRQIAAARTLAGLGQEELAKRARISVPTLRRMEASDGAAAGLPNNVAAVRSALEAAGIEFINGAQAGVRLSKSADTSEDLSAQIDALNDRHPSVDRTEPPSPSKAMRQLNHAQAQNEVTKLKNRRAKLKGTQ